MMKKYDNISYSKFLEQAAYKMADLLTIEKKF